MAKISTPSHPEDHHERHIYSTGGDALQGVALGAPVIINFTSDQTITSSNTLQNDDYFVIPLVANGKYAFQARLQLTTTLNTQLKWKFTGPSGFSGSLANMPQANVVAFSTLAYEGSSGIARDNQSFLIFGGALASSTAGDLQFQWSPNYSHSDEVIMHKESYVIWWRIA